MYIYVLLCLFIYFIAEMCYNSASFDMQNLIYFIDLLMQLKNQSIVVVAFYCFF